MIFGCDGTAKRSEEMTEESQEIESGKGKHQRTVTLTQDMAERLLRVCTHMGVTPSAYLKQVIGEAVCRHEGSLLPKQAADNSQAMMERFFANMAEAIQEEQSNEEPRTPKAKRPKA